MKMRSLAVLFCISTLLGYISTTSVQIPAGSTEHLYLMNVREGDLIGVRYQVISGGMMDVNVKVLAW